MNVDAAVRQMPRIKYCAEKAGIGHALFIGYGTLLGAIRENGLIGHDSDTDFCIRSDLVTKVQEQKFYEILDAEGMFEYRRRRKIRPDTGRYLWMSLKSELGGCKSCIWFQWPWNGYYWHTKGNRWVTKIGRKRKLDIDFKNTAAITKGVPIGYLSKLSTKKLYGERYNIPYMYGSCLSYWYGDFMTPREGGASSCEMLTIIGKWSDESTWKMLNMHNY